MVCYSTESVEFSINYFADISNMLIKKKLFSIITGKTVFYCNNIAKSDEIAYCL